MSTLRRVLPLATGFPWWAVLCDVLAVARLTRVATRDHLPPAQQLRSRLIRRGNGSPWSAVWVCPWCLGFWVALVVLGLHVLLALLTGLVGVVVYELLLAPLAVSHIVGMLAELEKA